MKNEILEEVWRVRDKISAECGYDLKKLVARMRRLEAKHTDRLVRLPIIRRRTATIKAKKPVHKRAVVHA